MSHQKKQHYQPILYGKKNLLIFLCSLVLIIIGYVLMSGGKSADGVSFREDVFSFSRIRLAPIFCTIGYLGILLAALYKGKEKHSQEEEK